MKFGSRLKRVRERKNLTQAQLGIMLGFNPVTASVRINQYEKNKKQPKEDILRKLEVILDVPREIFTGEVTEYAEAFIAGNMTLEEAYKGACDRSNYVFERSWDEACIYKYNGQIKFLDDYMKHYKISKPGNQMYINNIFVVC